MLNQYSEIIPIIREVARLHGYAIGEHGSMNRDCDLIAVPWVDNPSISDVMVYAVRDAVGGYIEPEYPIDKPQGRSGWVIQIGKGLYIDLSVFEPED